MSFPLIDWIFTAVDEGRTNLMNFPSVLFTKEYRFSLCESFGHEKILRHQYIFLYSLQNGCVWDLLSRCCGMDVLTRVLSELINSTSLDCPLCDPL